MKYLIVKDGAVIHRGRCSPDNLQNVITAKVGPGASIQIPLSEQGSISVLPDYDERKAAIHGRQAEVARAAMKSRAKAAPAVDRFAQVTNELNELLERLTAVEARLNDLNV